MRFLLDENLPGRLGHLLREANHDVVIVAESPLRGSSDRVLWLEARRESRVLITRDLDFPLPLAPGPPGLVLVRAPDSFSAASLSSLAIAYLAGAEPREVTGRITVISPGKVRSRTLPWL